MKLTQRQAQATRDCIVAAQRCGGMVSHLSFPAVWVRCSIVGDPIRIEEYGIKGYETYSDLPSFCAAYGLGCPQ